MPTKSSIELFRTSDRNGIKKVVRSFIKKVYIFLDIIVEFPTIGTLENSEKGIRGYSILKQISIFYKIEGHNIILLDFFDNRQDSHKKAF